MEDPVDPHLRSMCIYVDRSNEIKEPFVFQAFEDNNLTLFVQPKDPNTPMSGCLSFWRKLEHIR